MTEGVDMILPVKPETIHGIPVIRFALPKKTRKKKNRKTYSEIYYKLSSAMEN